MELTKLQMVKIGFFAGIGMYLSGIVCGLAGVLLSVIFR